MLPAGNRLTSSRVFAETVRRGRRAGGTRLVLHLATRPGTAAGEGGLPPQVGFVVSRAVGGAVVRNKVKRRLRDVAREQLPSLPRSAVLVVRAQPAAAAASYAELAADFEAAMARVLRRGERGS